MQQLNAKSPTNLMKDGISNRGNFSQFSNKCGSIFFSYFFNKNKTISRLFSLAASFSKSLLKKLIITTLKLMIKKYH